MSASYEDHTPSELASPISCLRDYHRQEYVNAAQMKHGLNFREDLFCSETVGHDAVLPCYQQVVSLYQAWSAEAKVRLLLNDLGAGAI